MSNDKIINNINDAVQEVRSSLTPYEIRYLKNKNVQKYNNNLLNWIYLSSSSSHSSLYSAQNVLKEQFNININDVLSRDFNVKQQFWCDFETKVTAHWENEMVESTPWTYEQVTEKKLNYCFQNSPYLKANIKKIPHANLLSKEMIGVGHGMMSSMCRLKLQWEKQNNLLPTSVVCKLTPTGLPQRVLSRSSALLKMEYLFYENIDTEKANNDIGINIPKIYYLDYRDSADRFTIIMEDLCDENGQNCQQIDQITGLTFDETLRLIKYCGKLHKYFVRQAETLLSPNIRTIAITDPLKKENTVNRMKRDLPVFLNIMKSKPFFIDIENSPIAKLAKVYSLNASEYYSYFNYTNDYFTVCHGDLRADNVMKSKDGTVIPIDLQCMKAAPGEFDIAYLLAGSMKVGDRRKYENELITMYFDERGYSTSYEKVLSLYHFNLFIAYGLMRFGITTLSTAMGESDRGTELNNVTLQRFFAAVEDWDTLRTVEDAILRVKAGKTSVPTEEECRKCLPQRKLDSLVDNINNHDAVSKK